MIGGSAAGVIAVDTPPVLSVLLSAGVDTPRAAVGKVSPVGDGDDDDGVLSAPAPAAWLAVAACMVDRAASLLRERGRPGNAPYDGAAPRYSGVVDDECVPASIVWCTLGLKTASSIMLGPASTGASGAAGEEGTGVDEVVLLIDRIAAVPEC